jgi:hypothetical protein
MQSVNAKWRTTETSEVRETIELLQKCDYYCNNRKLGDHRNLLSALSSVIMITALTIKARANVSIAVNNLPS